MIFKIGLKLEGDFPSGSDCSWFEIPESEYDKIAEMINEKWKRCE